MDQPFQAMVFCLAGHVQGSLDVDGIERLFALLYVQTDDIDRRPGPGECSAHSGFVAHVRTNLFYTVSGFGDWISDSNTYPRICVN